MVIHALRVELVMRREELLPIQWTMVITEPATVRAPRVAITIAVPLASLISGAKHSLTVQQCTVSFLYIQPKIL